MKSYTTACLSLIFLFINCSSGFSKPEVTSESIKIYEYSDYVYNKSSHLFYPADYKPCNPEKRVLSAEKFQVCLFAENFSQGRIVYAEITLNDSLNKKFAITRLVFNGIEVKVTECKWGYRAIFAIPPDVTPGKKELSVYWTDKDQEEKKDFQIDINKHKFAYYKRPMDLGKYSDIEYQEKPEVQLFIDECIKLKEKALSSSEPDFIDDSLAYPRDMHYVTSDFWAKRTIAQYKWRNGKKVHVKSRTRDHGGTDFRGKKGSAVYAMANGKVVLSRLLFFEGNLVIIDHGNRVFTCYMHMNGFNVKEGDKVKAGDLIGYVGDTGIATASHLHVTFLISGVQADPLSLLSLPIR